MDQVRVSPTVSTITMLLSSACPASLRVNTRARAAGSSEMLSASTLPSPCTLPTAASTPRSASLLPAAPQTFAAYQPTSDADKGGQRDARAGPELTGGRAVYKNGGERSRLLIVGTDCMGCARPVRPLPLPLSPPLSLPLSVQQTARLQAC